MRIAARGSNRPSLPRGSDIRGKIVRNITTRSFREGICLSLADASGFDWFSSHVHKFAMLGRTPSHAIHRARG